MKYKDSKIAGFFPCTCTAFLTIPVDSHFYLFSE